MYVWRCIECDTEIDADWTEIGQYVVDEDVYCGEHFPN